MAEKKSKKKKKFWRCGHFEYDYDGFGKYTYCHCQNAPYNCCPADNIFQMSVCPFFKRGKESFFFEDYGKYAREMNEFKESMEREMKRVELEERAELKRLKEKYES